MQITCPACSKTLQTKTDASGKSVKCSCGNTFVVPKAAGAAAAAAPPSPASVGKILVTCECGKRLQAPATAAGKAVKCSCGKAVKVPGGPATASAAPVAKAVAKPTPAAQARPAAAAPAARPVRPVAAAPAAPDAHSPFHAMSDDEWSSLMAKHTPKQPDPNEEPKKPKVNPILAKAVEELGADKHKKSSGAHGDVTQSALILMGVGALKLIVAIINFFLLDKEMEQLALEMQNQGDALDLTALHFVLQVFLGAQVFLSVVLIGLGGLTFVLPMTSAITGFVLWIILEISGLIINPFYLLSIRGWIFRIAVGSALVQGINNASYYSFMKRKEKQG